MFGARPLLALIPLLAAAAPAPLFNGKDLSGWVQEGPRPSFSVETGEIRSSGRGHAPNWLRTEREYENFRLRFEIRPAQWCETAVLLRAPRSDRPQHAGLAIFIGHDFHKQLTPHVTGAVLGVLPPKRALPASWDQWRKVDVLLDGDRLRVEIDGVVAQDLTLSDVPELRHRLRRGHIGFPDMGHRFALRSLTIEDRGGPTRFVELLKGDSLAGWDRRGGSGAWTARDGVVEGANGHSILYAPGEYGDFEFTAVVRSHARTNSGVFFRGDPQGPRRGFEVQIYSPVDAVYPTGSIYGLKRSRLQADLEERWFLLQVRVAGAKCTVWIDGEPAAEYDGLAEELRKPGRIGLQIHMEDTRVEFRDLRVRVL
jgi:hypothetical protein